MSIRRNNRSPWGWEQQTLINELKQGRELANQLKNHLNPCNTTSTQTRQFLVEKIISSYHKTLTKLNSNTTTNSPPKTHQVYTTNQASSSSKKRKALPKWTEQVKVKSENGLEGPLDDGHGWRKYGQKDILGAVHPRGYYRCTHRHVNGCLATKQVQRSDEDPNIFHITYQGHHTCTEQVEQGKRIKMDQFRFSSFGTPSGKELDDLNNMFISSVEVEGNQFLCFSPVYTTTSDANFFQTCNGLSQLNVDISESDLVEAGSCLNSVSNSPMGVLDLDLDFPTTGSAGVVAFEGFLYDLLDFE